MTANALQSDVEVVRGLVKACADSKTEPPYGRATWLLMVLYTDGDVVTMAGTETRCLKLDDLRARALSPLYYRNELVSVRTLRKSFRLWEKALCEHGVPFAMSEGVNKSTLCSTKVDEATLYLRSHGVPGQGSRTTRPRSFDSPMCLSRSAPTSSSTSCSFRR